MKVKAIAAVGLTALALAGCGAAPLPPHEADDRFVDVIVNGTRCILYAPGGGGEGIVIGSGGQGIAMQCDFAKSVPPQQNPVPPVDAGPSVVQESPTETTEATEVPQGTETPSP